MFHTVDNRPAEGDRTNGEGCGLISYATLEFLGVIKTRDRVVEKKKKSRCAVQTRSCSRTTPATTAPENSREQCNEGNVIGEKKIIN